MRKKYFLLVFCIVLGFALPAVAEVDIQTLEFQLLNQVNHYRQRQGLASLKRDREASRVARHHSQEMFLRDYFSLTSPGRGPLDYQLAYSRSSGRVVSSLIAIDYSVADLFSQIQSNASIVSEQATHMGVGLYQSPSTGKDPGAIWMTFIFMEYLAQAEPLPREVASGQSLTLKGRILNPALKVLNLPVTLPSGKVVYYRNRSAQKGAFQFTVPFRSGAGKYNLELLVSDPKAGPRVALIWPVYIDRPYPLKPELETALVDEHFASTVEASDYIFTELNRLRKKHQLSILERDSTLDYVAYLHSEDMVKRRFFAHVNPDGEDPNARFRKNGGYGSIGENIAYDTRVGSALQNLMESPGHRANILHPDFTHVGLGAYYNGTHYYITQLFQTRHPRPEPRQVKALLLEQIQSWSDPLPLEETALTRSAEQHSQWMARKQDLNYEINGVNFAQRLQKNGGQALTLNTLLFVATDTQNLLDQLEKQKKVFRSRRWQNLGIGISLSDHIEYGENTLWVTIALAVDN